MDDIILQSVIEITRQHDIDSLEVSLITTLAEFIPATAIFIVKPLDETKPGKFIEIMRLTISDEQGNQQKYEWTHDNAVDNGGHLLQECFTSMKPVHYKAEGKQGRFLFPIIHNNITDAILGVEASQDMNSWRAIIEAFVKIYSNYLAILNISERDKLTDLHNRRTFDYKLDKLLKSQRLQYQRYGSSTDANEKRRSSPAMNSWLAIADIDHFKRINDTYGHLFGDEVILIVSQQMKKYFRRSDLLFRFGGEEFVIVMPHTELCLAAEVAERIRAEVQTKMSITVSIGVAASAHGDTPTTLLNRADAALVRAKSAGRNCVYLHEGTMGHIVGVKSRPAPKPAWAAAKTCGLGDTTMADEIRRCLPGGGRNNSNAECGGRTASMGTRSTAK